MYPLVRMLTMLENVKIVFVNYKTLTFICLIPLHYHKINNKIIFLSCV